MSDLTALCMSCRDENKKPTVQGVNNPVVTKNEKGRYSAKGKCAKCEGNVFKFLSGVQGEEMLKAQEA